MSDRPKRHHDHGGPPLGDMVDGTGSLERLLKRDRGGVIASLIAVTLLAWVYLVILALDMATGDMSLMGMGRMAGAVVMEPHPWSWVTFVLMALMWWVMMIGMMVPSAAPMILLFARVQRRSLPEENPGRRIGLFTLGYLLIWMVFSLGATVLQWWLGELALVSPMMASTSEMLGAAIFAGAGLYQLTPLKHACLAHCRAPIQFLSAQWRKGDLGAFYMGIHHGAYCVGCCWVLMALLFVGGVMNLLWIAVIAFFVLLEKLAPRGQWLARFSGAAMLGLAAIMAAPALAGH